MTYIKTNDKIYNYNKIYYVDYDNFIYRLLVSKKTLQGYMFYCDGTFYALCDIDFNTMTVNYKETVMDILEAQVDTGGAFKFMGSVDAFEDLPTDASNGDVYQVGDKEYAWNGEEWVLLGFNMDLSDYATTQYVKDQDTILATGIQANQELITKEINDRKEADKANSDAIATNEEHITNEITERKAADTLLEGKITDVSTFKITLTEDKDTKTYTADKTYDEIKSAYDKNRTLFVSLDGAVLPMMNAEVNDTGTGFTFGYSEVQDGGEYVFTRSVRYFHSKDADTWEDSDKEGYYVKLEGITDPESGIVTFQVATDINMGEHNIVNVQKLHIDGQAPLYFGQVVETTVTNKPRLTGVVNSNAAAFVKCDKQTEYVPLFIGEPTDLNHAATKNYVDTTYGIKLDKVNDPAKFLRVYGVDKDGLQKTFNATEDMVTGAIPIRNTETGVICVGTPSEESHATTKKYVDDAILNKQDKIGTLTTNTVDEKKEQQLQINNDVDTFYFDTKHHTIQSSDTFAVTTKGDKPTYLTLDSTGALSLKNSDGPIEPKTAEDLVVKKYVDEACKKLNDSKVSMITSIDTYDRLYAVSKAGADAQFNVSDTAVASTIPLRGTDGTLKVTTPKENNDAATKQYVDEKTTTQFSYDATTKTLTITA